MSCNLISTPKWVRERERENTRQLIYTQNELSMPSWRCRKMYCIKKPIERSVEWIEWTMEKTIKFHSPQSIRSRVDLQGISKKKSIMKWKIQCDVENRGRKVNLISIFILNLIRCSMFIQQDIFLLLFIYFSSEAIRAWMAGIFFSSRVVSVWLINTRKWKLIMHLSRTQKKIY